ncbi:hypothetical protein EMCRGX_G033222 [Ephydatia muelleri]
MQPYKQYWFLSTSQLAASIVKSLQGTIEDEQVYRKHLALFRMFIRHCNAKEEANHTQFEWYHTHDISDEEWKAIIEEEEAHNYELNGHGMCYESAPLQQEDVQNT